MKHILMIGGLMTIVGTGVAAQSAANTYLVDVGKGEKNRLPGVTLGTGSFLARAMNLQATSESSNIVGEIRGDLALDVQARNRSDNGSQTIWIGFNRLGYGHSIP